MSELLRATIALQDDSIHMLEAENKRLTADAACNEAQLKNIVGYVEQLQVKVEQLEGAARKTLKEQDEADEHHSSACMNWTFCEHSQHQCGLCDLRAAIKGDT